MKIKEYLLEKYIMDYKITMKNGQEESDREIFNDRKDAVDILNNYKSGGSGLAYDKIKDMHFWDDKGNEVQIMFDGKLNKKKITTRDLK